MTNETKAISGLTVDFSEILKRIPHRYPFLLVDRGEDWIMNTSMTGIKNVTFNEPFFQGHFPNNPVMPGVLIIEAIAQTGAVLMSKSLDADVEGKTIFFTTIDEVRFRSPVRPGDTIRMPVEVLKHSEVKPGSAKKWPVNVTLPLWSWITHNECPYSSHSHCLRKRQAGRKCQYWTLLHSRGASEVGRWRHA